MGTQTQGAEPMGTQTNREQNQWDCFCLFPDSQVLQAQSNKTLSIERFPRKNTKFVTSEATQEEQ